MGEQFFRGLFRILPAFPIHLRVLYYPRLRRVWRFQISAKISRFQSRFPKISTRSVRDFKEWAAKDHINTVKQDDERRQRLSRGSSPCSSVDPRATGTRTEAEVTSTHSWRVYFLYSSSYRRDSGSPSKMRNDVVATYRTPAPYERCRARLWGPAWSDDMCGKR